MGLRLGCPILCSPTAIGGPPPWVPHSLRLHRKGWGIAPKRDPPPPNLNQGQQNASSWRTCSRAGCPPPHGSPTAIGGPPPWVPHSLRLYRKGWGIVRKARPAPARSKPAATECLQLPIHAPGAPPHGSSTSIGGPPPWVPHSLRLYRKGWVSRGSATAPTNPKRGNRTPPRGVVNPIAESY